jgi:hypothetical protein
MLLSFDPVRSRFLCSIRQVIYFVCEVNTVESFSKSFLGSYISTTWFSPSVAPIAN